MQSINTNESVVLQAVGGAVAAATDMNPDSLVTVTGSTFSENFGASLSMKKALCVCQHISVC
jgi:hypothetical protein